jgi:putative sterol carrier protein
MLCLRNILDIEPLPLTALLLKQAPPRARGYIWKHKRYLTRPVLCDGDGPYQLLRHWTSQFFVPESEECARNLAKGEPSSRMSVQDEPDREVSSAETAAPIGACTQPPPAQVQAESVCTAPAAGLAGTGSQGSAKAVSHIFFEKMAAQFNPAAVTSNFVVQYEIGGEEGGVYVVEVRDRQYQVTEGKHEAPDVCVRIQATDWLCLHSGELGSARAYLSGRLKVSGDMKLARHLATIFPIRS